MSTQHDLDAWACKQADLLREIASTSETLPEYLQKFVFGVLGWLQKNEGREQIPDLLANLWDVRSNSVFLLMQWSAHRMYESTKQFRQARFTREVYSWVLPQTAALAFEGILDICVLYWLQDEGKPLPNHEFSPAVENFVISQVRLFACWIGAGR